MKPVPRERPRRPPKHRAHRVVGPRSGFRAGPKVRPSLTGPVEVELISVGAELLRGHVADGNAYRLARRLSQRGAIVRRIAVVGDAEEAIAAAVREALARHPRLLVTTGGLGPGLDDRTLAALAEALRVPLALHAGARTLVESAYQRLREQRVVTTGGLTAAREKMCRIPLGSSPVPNPIGVAPGVLLRMAGGATVLCLPGLPEEMEAVFDRAAPLLRDVAPSTEVAQREIESPTADESALRPMIDRLAAEFPDVWINSHPPGTRRRDARTMITLEATGRTQIEANAAVEKAMNRLLALAAGSP